GEPGCGGFDCCSLPENSWNTDAMKARCGGRNWISCDDDPDMKRTCLATMSKQDCTAAFRRMQGIIDYCNGTRPIDNQYAGYTICCSNGQRLKSCGYRCCPENTPGDDCYDYCLGVHESVHAKACEAQNGNWRDEVCPSLAQAQCYWGLLAKQCNWARSQFIGLDKCRNSGKGC